MFKNNIKEAIIFIKRFLRGRGISIDRIVLFGSYAENTFSQESDVDIAIISSDFEHKDIFQRSEMLKGLDWDLVERFMLPFDVVPISSQEWRESSSFIVDFAHRGIEA